MTSHRALFLHKTEWERINRKELLNLKYNNEDYIKSLNESSQKWIKSWPDSVEGHVCLAEKQTLIQRSKNIAFMRNYLSKAERKRVINKESIKQARELIFEDSCYGRKLLSAFLESKTLEERNIQIEFQKKIKDEAKIRQQTASLCNSIENADEMEKKETLIKLKQQEDNLRTVQFNKLITEKQKEHRKKEQMEKLQKMPDITFTKNIIAREEMEKEKRKRDMRKEIEDFMKVRECIKEMKKQQEFETSNNIEKIREDQERVNCKIKAVNNKIMQRNSKRTASVYNQLQLLKEEEQSRYDTFIESGIKRQSLKETEVPIKPTFERGEKLVFQNKKLKECKHHPDIRLCVRQCIISKSRVDKNYKQNRMLETDLKCMKFLQPKKLVEDYKKRQQEPSPWTGLAVAHEQFAEHATNIIKECRYKHTARRVINEYRRTNCLDATTLPILNY